MIKKLFSTRLDEFVRPDVAILLLRIGAAALMLTHGIPKLLKVLEGDFSFGDPIGIGPTASLILVAFAEAICAALVVIGLMTRISLIPLIITMIVAVFVAHAGDPFSDKELGLFFLISFVVLFLTGPGKYSLDRKLFGK
ncbi:DoxX family protein [Rhodohalobacter sp.]|uniref:DoxX family protein n=1 Tax=Rhodohalobacter sp. TaxID=1974210 RepID=UPI002ACEEA77|nr:DoxX family protein [Rhodohalobacter sp.]MDZ7758193.1 DoxX family protein [Rhodohalobacter sp.]